MTQIKGNFGSAYAIEMEVAVSAAKAVVLGNENPADALLCLDMLGLIEPMEHNQPVNHAKRKREMDLELRRSKKQTRRERKEQNKREYQERELERLGVEPHEIGE